MNERINYSDLVAFIADDIRMTADDNETDIAHVTGLYFEGLQRDVEEVLEETSGEQ